MARTKRGPNDPIIIKKYANRRLYDTGRSSYVTLDDLCEMIKEGHDFVVQDAKSGQDITRAVLTQIIVEQESRSGQNLLPTNFLRTLIGFYGDNVQGIVPNYLEQTLDLFVNNQERVREQVNKSFEGMRSIDGMFPGSAALDELNRKNMAMFERTMKMFTPFSVSNPHADNADPAKQDKINELKRGIQEMEKELNKLSDV